MLKSEIVSFLVFTNTIMKTVNSAHQGRIIDGAFARIEDFPHSAFLNVGCTDTVVICGASVLNQRLLLTAGHCVYECRLGHAQSHSVEAYFGQSDIKKVFISSVATDIIIHEDYDDVTVENDIAIVMVQDKIPFSSNVKRVAITEVWSVQEQNGFVAGWGMYHPGIQEFSMRLRYTIQKISPMNGCKIFRLSPGTFCAGNLGRSIPTASMGDSGSALVVKDQNYHQIGIVSYSVDKYPGLMVYTNVTFFYKWIASHSKTIFCRDETNQLR